MEPLQQTIEQLNDQLKEFGILPIELVSPDACMEQELNARYMPSEKMDQLIRNIQQAGTLESVPLVYRDQEDPQMFHIISGKHRVEGAKAAGLQKILVFVDTPGSRDQIISKQLAHNALVGEDDAGILARLFQSISSVDLRIATGLDDSLMKLDFQSMNFRVGEYRELTMLFLTEEMIEFEERLEGLAKSTEVKSRTSVHLAPMEYWERFGKVLRRIKKVENIKNNAVAVMRLVELAEIGLAVMQEQLEKEQEAA